MGVHLTKRPTMKVLVLTLAAVGTAIAAGKGKMGGKGKEFMEMMGSQGGKMPEMVQEMMAEKEGLCLSQDEVHMICGMGTNLQRKMDAALKQCMPREMMAAAMDDMQDMSMSPDTKLLSSGRAFDFEEPSERGKKKEVMKKMKGKKGKKPSRSKKPPKKPSGFKSCEASCPSMDEMRASGMEEIETELCVLNAIGWIDAEGNMKQDVEDADMAEFPAAVKEAVSESKIKDCAEVATAR